MNMLYAGFLPAFFASLLWATEPRRARARGARLEPLESQPSEPHRARASQWQSYAPIVLAGSVLLVAFSSTVNAIFATNLVVVTFLWRLWNVRSLRSVAIRFSRALLPTLVVIVPYVMMVGYYVVRYEFDLTVPLRLNYIPELASYVVPFTPTSVYSDWAAVALLSPGAFFETGRIDLRRFDLACYLGLLVLPMCIAGMVLWRKNANVRLCMVVLSFFLVLSMGPKLMFLRDVVRIGGHEVNLPFKVWQEFPVVGAVAQAGRYVVLCYMAMAAGMACLVATVRARQGRWQGTAITVFIAGLVCLDYAFLPGTSDLPPFPVLSTRPGRVLDPRLRSGATMYYQTEHERQLVGG